jgi:ornithine cyclodeaminase
MVMAADALWVSEHEIADLLTLADAIDVLADAHRLYARGEAANMARTHAEAAGSNLHAVGGLLTGSGVAGTKTWIHTPGGASPLLILFSPVTGEVLGVVEAFAVGKLRTAATAGLGTRELARRDADTLALLGTGKQAITQAEAVHAVRPLRAIRVFGRDAARREAFVARLAERVPADVTGHDSVDAVLDGERGVVTLVTRAAEPLLLGPHVLDGVHVNAVGAIMPGRRELDAEAVGRCQVVAVDSREQALHDSSELAVAVDAGRLEWESVHELGALLEGSAAGRTDERDVTLFKALGVGIADVALGVELLRRARGAGAGAPLPRSEASRSGLNDLDSRRTTRV